MECYRIERTNIFFHFLLSSIILNHVGFTARYPRCRTIHTKRVLLENLPVRVFKYDTVNRSVPDPLL